MAFPSPLLPVASACHLSSTGEQCSVIWRGQKDQNFGSPAELPALLTWCCSTPGGWQGWRKHLADFLIHGPAFAPVHRSLPWLVWQVQAVYPLMSRSDVPLLSLDNVTPHSFIYLLCSFLIYPQSPFWWSPDLIHLRLKQLQTLQNIPHVQVSSPSLMLAFHTVLSPQPGRILPLLEAARLEWWSRGSWKTVALFLFIRVPASYSNRELPFFVVQSWILLKGDTF